MKVTILYTSRRGATRQIVEWMSEYLAKNNDIQLDVYEIEDDIDSIDTDLLLVGYPIYFEKPWKKITRWMEDNIQNIHATHTALFILGWAKSMYSRVEGHIEKDYYGPIERHFSEILITKHMFRGWVRKKDSKQKGESEEWIKEVLDVVSYSSA